MKNSSDRHNIGIIGYGGFGKFLHNSWKSMKNAKVAAVSDSNHDCRADGDVKFYENWKDLIKDKDIDIVSIATPPSFHADMACAAMDEGKHVIIEKPLAIKPEDGEKIIKKRDETGRIATVNYMQRFNPIVEVLSLLSKAGVFGELRRVDVENYAQDSSLPESHWFWNKDISGGILIEHAVHFIDLVHSLTDQKYKEVSGMSFSRNERQEDQVIANIIYDRGLIVTQYHSFSCPGFFEATSMLLCYDLARIKLAGWIPLWGEISALVRDKRGKNFKKFPNFKLISSIKVGEVEDLSRPPGWGKKETDEKLPHKTIYCSGIGYKVNEMISGNFNIGLTKGEVYSECVREILKDFISSIENPKHKLRISLEDGLESLKIAAIAR